MLDLDLDLLIEEILEEVDGSRDLEDQEFFKEIDGTKYEFRFDEVHDDDWTDEGKYAYSYKVFRVSQYTTEGEFIEDLDIYLKQDVTRSGSYFSYYEYEYEAPYQVVEEERTIVEKYWKAV